MYVLTSFYIFAANRVSDVLNHLASDDKHNNDLCEITSSHVKTQAILSDNSFDSNSMIENIQFHPTSK